MKQVAPCVSCREMHIMNSVLAAFNLALAFLLQAFSAFKKSLQKEKLKKLAKKKACKKEIEK